MRWLIAIVLIVGLFWGSYQTWEYYQTFEKKQPARPDDPIAVDIGNQLEGMPPELQPALDQAKSMGAKALGHWIEKNKKKLKDPRLGWIQLDYVVLVAPTDLAAARKVFKEVKERTDPASPVIPRIRQLEKTYQ